MILFIEGSRYSNCSPVFIKGLSWLICLRLFVLLCFADLASFSNPDPSECSLSCLLWIDLQKDATGQLLRFSTCHCTSHWSKTCIGWKFDRKKKNLFIFPCLIHKIKEVFSQKCSKVSVSKRGTNAFIPRILGKKKNLFSMALSIICCVGGQESKKQCIQSWSGRRLGVLSKTK